MNTRIGAERVSLIRPGSQASDAAPSQAGESGPADASVTALRPGELAKAAADLPAKTSPAENARDDLVETMESAAKNHTKAMNAGVNSAKKSFAMKALGIGLAALGVAVVASLTVATGGGALIAAAAVAGVVFAVSVADAGCAYMNLKNAQAVRDGKPAPYDLPGGSSSIRNLVHLSLREVGCSEERSSLVAGWVDGLLRIGMGVVTAVCTMGVTVGAESFERIAPIVAAAVNLAQSLVDLSLNRFTTNVMADSAKSMETDFETARRRINSLKAEIHKQLGNEEITQEAADEALQQIEQFETKLDACQAQFTRDLEAMKELTPNLAAGVAVAVPSAAVVAMALVPGLEALRPDLVHVSPRGGNAGGVRSDDERAGLRDPLKFA